MGAKKKGGKKGKGKKGKKEEVKQEETGTYSARVLLQCCCRQRLALYMRTAWRLYITLEPKQYSYEYK